jgi:cytidylate kinase
MIYDYLPPNKGVFLNKKPLIDINFLKEMQKSNYVICIDGLAGSGKSTLGKRLSNSLNIPHISSGIFYRVFTYIFCVFDISFTPNNIDSIGNDITFHVTEKEFTILYKENKIPMSELKNDVIDAALNRYSTDIYFRNAVSKILVKMVQSLQHSFILDLRGAYPDYVKEIENQKRPVIKLLLVANTEIKAQRRLEEYMNSKYSKDKYYQSEIHQKELYESLKSKIIERDNLDIQSILKTDIGLIDEQSGVIDTSEITEEQVLELALNYIQTILKN